MINVTKDTRIPSVDEVLNILTMYNTQNPQYVDYDKLMMNLSALSYKVDVESKNLSNMILKQFSISGGAIKIGNLLMLSKRI